MDIRGKIIKALTEFIEVHYVRLEEDVGISGFVVSPQFQRMPMLDRQGLIDDAMSKSSNPLTLNEQRRILMIAGLTPEEYETVGARTRVHRVKELAGGAVEIVLDGGVSDAQYVRGALNNQKGVQTTEPKQVSGAVGTLMSFRATGTGPTPLTKAKTIRILKSDRYIDVMSNA